MPGLRPPRLPSWARYLGALASVGLAAAIQYLLLPEPSIAPFVFLFFGVTLGAWLGGRGPGCVAVLLAAALGNYLFIQPVFDWSLSRGALLATGFFLVAALAAAILTGSLRAALRDLEAKAAQLGALHEAQARLAAELRVSQQRKDDFLATLSHELRNPLTPIRSGVYVLKRTCALDHRGREATGVIERQVDQLARLIDDLLDATRIARGKIQLRRTRLDLAEAIARSAQDFRSLFTANGVELSVGLHARPVWVDADPARVAQIVGNLLSNSAKFTPRGGRVSVSLAADDLGRAVLEVSDTGVGLDEETRAHLFEPFAQADRSLARSRGGLGLGLALVKGLVELHGGEVQAHSDGPDRGTRFTIQLPLTASPADPAAVTLAHDQPPPHPASRRVLVVEDNQDSADLLKEVLELGGHRVEVAYTGQQGLTRARDFLPDVVLCDLGLPDLDGFAVARELRKEPGLAPVWLVALTGYAQPEDRRRAREAGFDQHLAKPPDFEAIDQLLAECCP